GHHPRVSVWSYMHSGCPHCRGAKTAKTKPRLAEIQLEISSQWHPTRNGSLRPQDVAWDSRKLVWWQADCCGHEWQEPIRDRDKSHRWRCPECRTILDSLAWQDPGLAAEWSPINPITAWFVRPHTGTTFVPEWICATNSAHVWSAPLTGRSNGAECPECRES